MTPITDLDLARNLVARNRAVTVAVESTTRPGLMHTLRVKAITGEAESCTCEAGRRRLTCRHMKAVSDACAPERFTVEVHFDDRRKSSTAPLARRVAWTVAKGSKTKTTAHTIYVRRCDAHHSIAYIIQREGVSWVEYKPGEHPHADMWDALDAA